MGMLILQRPCQSAAPVPQHKRILRYFSWKTMRVCNEGVLSASRWRQSAQSLQTGTQGGRDSPGKEPRMRPLWGSLLRYKAPLFPSPGLPTLLPLILFVFLRPFVGHVMEGSVYPYGGNS